MPFASARVLSASSASLPNSPFGLFPSPTDSLVGLFLSLANSLVGRALGHEQHPLEGLVGGARFGRRLLGPKCPLRRLTKALGELLHRHGRLLEELVYIFGVVTAAQFFTELHVAEDLRGQFHARQWYQLRPPTWDLPPSRWPPAASYMCMRAKTSWVSR